MSSTNNTTVNSVAIAITNKKEEEKNKLLLPDSPRTKSRKYQEYTDKEDYQGAAEYLQDQLNKKYALMSPEELEAHLEDMSD